MNAPVLPRIVGTNQEPPEGTRKWLLEHPAATYHADLTAISQGALQWIENSPAHFIRHYGRRINTSPDMRLGSLLHLALLEPHLYGQQILQPAFGDLRFKGPKAAKAEWLDELPIKYVALDDDGKRTGLLPDAPVMTPAEKEAVEGMAASVLSSKLIASLLKDSITEATTYWVDPDTGLLRRARLDIVSPARIVLDLKTTESAMRQEVARRIHQNSYDFQGASYVTAADMVSPGPQHAFGLVALERDPPYGVRLYMLKPRALARGAARVSAALRTLKSCIEANTWPGYPDTAEDIDLPEYAYTPTAEGGF